jgi:hypothetical protein
MAYITVIRKDEDFKKLVIAINIDTYYTPETEGDEAYMLYAVADERFVSGDHDAKIIGAFTKEEKRKFGFSWRHIS